MGVLVALGVAELGGTRVVPVAQMRRHQPGLARLDVGHRRAQRRRDGVGLRAPSPGARWRAPTSAAPPACRSAAPSARRPPRSAAPSDRPSRCPRWPGSSAGGRRTAGPPPRSASAPGSAARRRRRSRAPTWLRIQTFDSPLLKKPKGFIRNQKVLKKPTSIVSHNSLARARAVLEKIGRAEPGHEGEGADKGQDKDANERGGHPSDAKPLDCCVSTIDPRIVFP